MIDPADKQTAALPLEQPKRGRGRPATGKAMTPAEKQKAYRQRLAEQRNNQVPAVQLEKVRSTAAEYLEKLGQQLADAKAETAAAIARAEKAESNVTVKGDTFYNKETVVDLELEVIRLRKANKELAQIAQEEVDARVAEITRADQAEKDLEILQKKIHKTLANNTEIRKDLELKETQLRHWIERAETAERELESRDGKTFWDVESRPKGKRTWSIIGSEGEPFGSRKTAEEFAERLRSDKSAMADGWKYRVVQAKAPK